MKQLLAAVLFMVSLPALAVMDVTRELASPDKLVPGQPVTVAVTFWTDSWFTPPPAWPEMQIENGNLLTTPLPHQLVSRNEQGISWSGIRMERQIIAWDQGTLHLPAMAMTLRSANQPPATFTLPALDKPVAWPEDVRQPDRFLPASSLTMTQTWQRYQAEKGSELHVGDVIERVVTLRATGVVAAQIPQLLYAIPGTGAQRLTPENSPLKQGRDDIVGAQRIERLRYLPSQPGELMLPPLRLRWWDTRQQTWQLTELPGARFTLLAARPAGSEQALKASTPVDWQSMSIVIVVVGALLLILVYFRRALGRALRFIAYRICDFWRVISLPELTPLHRKKR